jgi:hypothetical protein
LENINPVRNMATRIFIKEKLVSAGGMIGLVLRSYMNMMSYQIDQDHQNISSLKSMINREQTDHVATVTAIVNRKNSTECGCPNLWYS